MDARPKEVDGARGRASARSALAGLAAPLTVAATQLGGKVSLFSAASFT